MENIVVVYGEESSGKLTVMGRFGTRLAFGFNPVEIGLAVKEVMTGEFLSPPMEFHGRVKDEDPNGIEGVDGEGDTND